MEEKKVSEQQLIDDYQKHYNKNAAYKLLKELRKKTRNLPSIVAGATGAVVLSLGSLLSALENPETPPAMKALILGAIGYIIFPIDLIPDLLPVVGYSDDVASAAGVVAAVAAYSTFSLEELDSVIDKESET